MDFFKETSEHGVQYFYAKQPDFDYAIQVAIHPGKLVNALRLAPLPKDVELMPIDRDRFAEAFNLASDFFTDFLKMNPNHSIL